MGGVSEWRDWELDDLRERVRAVEERWLAEGARRRQEIRDRVLSARYEASTWSEACEKFFRHCEREEDGMVEAASFLLERCRALYAARAEEFLELQNAIEALHKEIVGELVSELMQVGFVDIAEVLRGAGSPQDFLDEFSMPF